MLIKEQQKPNAEKQNLKGQRLYFNHWVSFDTTGPVSPSSEGTSLIIEFVDEFSHYVALNPVLRCNAYYAYKTLYKHWIARFWLPETLVTDNRTKYLSNITSITSNKNIEQLMPHESRDQLKVWTALYKTTVAV